MLTAAELRERLDYNPETGEFIWRYSPNHPPKWNGRFAGKVAGSARDDGYWAIRVNYTRYMAHRLAWLYMTGEWPADEIDHINCDRSDTRFSNLRAATRHQNAGNTRRPSDNTSGFKGVCFDRSRGKWIAMICAHGRQKNLGRFPTAEAASAAYIRASKDVFGPFARAA